MLFEVDPYDPLTFAAATILLIAGSAVASYVPVRRATQIDAATRLRG